MLLERFDLVVVCFIDCVCDVLLVSRPINLANSKNVLLTTAMILLWITIYYNILAFPLTTARCLRQLYIPLYMIKPKLGECKFFQVFGKVDLIIDILFPFRSTD